MSTTLRSIVKASVDATYKNLLDLGTPTDAFSKTYTIEMSNGTGSNSADLMFSDQRTLAASGTEDLDLAGSLTNAFGSTLTYVELRAVLVSAASANTNNVLVSRPATNGVPLFSAAGDQIIIPPGGVFLWSCPADGKVAVTASTGDLLTVTNSAGSTSVTYDVIIIGVSA